MKDFNSLKKAGFEKQSVNWIIDHARELTREGLLFVLEQIDPNGIWSDKASAAYGYDPLSFDDALESFMRLVVDLNPLELQLKEIGFYVPACISDPASLESYTQNYYDTSFKNLSEKEKWSVIFALS